MICKNKFQDWEPILLTPYVELFLVFLLFMEVGGGHIHRS
jgi:hypothetical protein